jgi:hypothetical protein
MKHKHLGSTVASAFLLLATGAAASAQIPERVRGTVESLKGDELTVKSREGNDIKIKLAPDTHVTESIPASMDEIKQGTFVGITASGPESRMRAVEVHLFPESMRGVGEGHYPWDLEPGTSMTNGNIDGEVSSSTGRQLTVSYKGGTAKITIPPNVPVVMLSPGDKSEIVPGAKVFIPGGHRDPDGSVSAARIVVGKNGTTPPM